MFKEPQAVFDAMRLNIASPGRIKEWSYGEVSKPETINYRTQKPEKGGLFAEEIFGPTKDWECYCGKYKKIRYKGIICDKCGVEVTHSLVRRERMGHIDLAVPVAHIWFLRSIPSKIGTVLDMSILALEKVVYFNNFIITHVDENLKVQTHEQLKAEYKSKLKALQNEHKRKLEEISIRAGADASHFMEKAATEHDRKVVALDADFMAAEKELKELTLLNLLTENEYREYSLRYGHLFDAGIGAEAIRELLGKIDLSATIKKLEEDATDAPPARRERMIRRLKLLKSMNQNRIEPEWMVMTAIPVVPPDLRPMVALDGGRFATSDLNDLYRRVINRNNRLKRLQELNAPEVICRNEKRMLQEAVDALIDNSARHTKTVTASTGQKRSLRSLADILKGKQGRFRQNLLGKRTDYSGRSVIVVGPELKLDECGLPKRMALELFKPFVMSQIISRGLAHNIRSASRYIEGDHEEVWDILEEITKGTHVLLNRAPTLHRLGIQAFRPRLIEGKAIQVHPLVCTAFNADFDGDQMAVHVPLTEEAKREAAELMLATKNLLKPATGAPVATPKQDIAWGVFYLTMVRAEKESSRMKVFYSPDEAKLVYKLRKIGLQEVITVRFEDLKKFPDAESNLIKTTVGRILFNEALISELGLPFFNEVVTSKRLGDIVRQCLEVGGQEQTSIILDNIKTLGFKYITKSGFSLAMADFPLVPAKQKLLGEGDARVLEIEEQYAEGLLTDQERHNKIIEVWSEIKDQVSRASKGMLDKFTSVSTIIESGARGTWGQLTQVIGMKGLVSNPTGDIIELPVKGSFKEGFDVLEFFISTHGTRKGLSDTALRTANAGYLTRRLVDVSQDIVVREEDCGDTEGILINYEDSNEMGETVFGRAFGRTVVKDVKDPKGKKILIKAGESVDEKHMRVLEKTEIKEVSVRSILQCRLPKGVCQKCYGYDLATNRLVDIGVAVGIIAAQSIGEPGTQLTMRTFHTGGVAAAGGDITQGLPRVEELFESRSPKKKAYVSDVSGQVEVVSTEQRVIESPEGKQIFEGRFGQKVIRIQHTSPGEAVFSIMSVDEVLVKEGSTVTAGEALIKRKSGENVLATMGGSVVVEKKKLKVVGMVEGVKEYIIPAGYTIWVKNGDLVNIGDQLTEGHLDLHHLFALKGRESVQRYILREIQNIYSSQGQKLNDKHIEIIIHQMFSRVLVSDAGDTDLLPGEIVEKAQFMNANLHARKEKKNLAIAEELLLGVTKVSLTTQSFLSAASFQETAKVLINAAITGKIDRLEGLKENVIIGRLIPAGTGFRTI
ncbi:MAG: DNA-directed RNA polymerase subunit beta' [Candidatus Magasanikbacteria bacterium GW2011_GWA2_45_39]|uniref:DNA-directed RNA polymerase subunit beta' n=2 Tax=Candidatus Magasanikiibacteriota TaxID=1752731 RepID=A0A0G1QZ36_9BACT|nr:MAG: DNA-directed RNA polymerase subunit beta' [Candidatus Magasanikbacteria bacterium GW2011_GWA2_45_39]KKU13950.1 MAG: DNA-directed RNA polymerase subunit beta' [Candidatus Magasanikbacteria bacterium GW2011_GWC2_45_8]HBW74103.1 DNA-directed RNA polymerase subunit beta' [Candidatus Magasanikbacteria bacterium]